MTREEIMELDLDGIEARKAEMKAEFETAAKDDTAALDEIEAEKAAIALREQLELKEQEKLQKAQKKEEEKAEKERRQKFNNSVVGKITNSAITSIGRELGRQLVRGILGSLKSK